MNERPREVPSLLRDSSARLVAELVAAAAMLVTGVVIARTLGPDGKGVIATLSYLVVLMGQLGVLGLGDAAIVLEARTPALGRRGLEALTGGTLALSSITAAAIPLYGVLFLADSHPLTLGLAALAVPSWAATSLFTGIENARGHVAFTSFVHALQAAVTAVGTVALVFLLRLEEPGALVALLLGPLSAAVILAAHLRRRGLPLMPRLRLPPLRRAVRIGVPIQLAVLLQTLSARADVLVVLGMLGPVAAGQYSVAVTAGQLALYVPYAVALAAFPALAATDEGELAERLVRLFRLTLAGGSLIAAGLFVAVPPLLPMVFGHGFAPSVTPALILLLAALVSSEQWVLARALSARGRTNVLLRSYVVSTATMVALDLILIGRLGLTGAAIASVVAPLAGLAVLLPRIRELVPGARVLTLLPKPEDFVETVRLLQRALRAAAARTSRSDPRTGDQP